MKLTNVILSAPVTDEEYLDVELFPEKGNFRCKIPIWPSSGGDYVEHHLRQAGYKLRRPWGRKPRFFTLPAEDIWTTLATVRDIFVPTFEFEPPMFWYNGPNIDNTELEIVVTDLNPNHSHVVIGPHSDTTIDDLDAVAQAAYIEALQRSGLCVPTSVFCEHGQFYAQLTVPASQNPLEAFYCLVQLHPSSAG